MSLKATSFLRSVALLGAATAASAMLAQVAMAQGPGPRIPGQNPYYSRPVDQGFSPRPDFPGAKQSNMAKTSRSAKHHKTISQQ
jgi:hypothetical protein